MIYLDNAATSFFKPPEMIQAVCEYLKHPGNPNRGSHHMAMDAARIVLDTRMELAEFFDCDFSKVIFTSGITESLNTVICGMFTAADHIITTHMEHNSVLRPLYRLGCELSVSDGNPARMETLLGKNTKAVIMNHVSNVTGEINDIRSVGEFCRGHGLLFIVDTAQSAGLLPISMEKDNIDVLCFTGHKGLLGMQGIGGLCVGTEQKIEPLKVGGSGVRSFDRKHPDTYPSALEAGTQNVPGIVSLNASLKYLKERGIDSILEHERRLAEYFAGQIASYDRVKIYRNAAKEHVGIVSFNIDGMDAGAVSDRLSRTFEIETRAGAHCAPLLHGHYETQSMVRVSFGVHNTKEEADICVQALRQILENRTDDAG